MRRIFHRLAARAGTGRSRVFHMAMLLVLILALVTVIWLGFEFVALQVTSWQGAHGHYPTGHLTYAVPNGWNTTTLTGLSIKNTGVWWDVFDDQVSVVSPTYAACFTQPCAAGSDRGAIVYLESGPDQGQSTIEGWYRALEDATARRLGPDVVLPLADYTRVPLGGQTALCAANQAGSQMISPKPPPSPHFNSTFSGYSPSYSSAAALMCFAMWQDRAYYVEVDVQLHTATQADDLRNAVRMVKSLHFV